MTNREAEIIEMMKKHGGAFVQSLARAFELADPDNFTKLKNCFRIIWNEYSEIYDKLMRVGQH